MKQKHRCIVSKGILGYDTYRLGGWGGGIIVKRSRTNLLSEGCWKEGRKKGKFIKRSRDWCSVFLKAKFLEQPENSLLFFFHVSL